MLKLTILTLISSVYLFACGETALNNPYADSDQQQSILYKSFSERPKHLDPAVSYSANEYDLIAQIYEPPLQYHYLDRPYRLTPLTATKMPEINYIDHDGKIINGNPDVDCIAFTDYILEIKQGVQYQPHPALARTDKQYRYHQLNTDALADISTLADFAYTGTRELVAEDYVYQIKRLVHPSIHSPIAEMMTQHIVGLQTFSKRVTTADWQQFRTEPISGVTALDRYRYRIRIKGKYPQFKFWLAMPFFAPMPWEADVFYNQAGLAENNISLNWYPLGTGPYLLKENNPNRRMVLLKNPNHYEEFYPNSSEPDNIGNGLLDDAGKKMPFIDKAVFILEKENIPYWNKFLQGYYDSSGIASDSFDQAVQFSSEGLVELTVEMQARKIKLQTAVTTSIFYIGFNMLDKVIGGTEQQARLLRLAISIAIDYEEYIAIFANGRGIAGQGILPPGIYGHSDGLVGINPYLYDWQNDVAIRKDINVAKQLMTEAGYLNGIDPSTGEALILYLDTPASAPDDRARLNWYRKQFTKLGIQLVIRATDYNRFQQKMRSGNAQIFMWGWNADYPDPENFFFLLYGPNGKVKNGGENAGNYNNPNFDRLFEQMRNMDNGSERFQLIQQLQEIIRHDAPWVFAYHPKSFNLYHQWLGNLKPNFMANNTLKYIRINTKQRQQLRQQWNHPVLWPLAILILVLVLIIIQVVCVQRSRNQETIQ